MTPEQKQTNADTLTHIHCVGGRIGEVICSLIARAHDHDQSKLQEPELSAFTEMTPKLAGSTYGSDEYKGFLEQMKPALDHHYSENKHHPEHWRTRVSGMSLVDIVEMLADWKAATLRHNDGDIRKSIEINANRFGINDQLKQILINTVERMGW